MTSYLVASSPEVLTQILKDNESRGIEFNPSLYTHPANALNTTKVEFAAASGAATTVHNHHQLPPSSPLPTAKRSQQQQQPISMPVGSNRSLPGSGHSTLSRSGSCGGSLEKSLRPGCGSRVAGGRKQSLPVCSSGQVQYSTQQNAA